MITEIFYPAKCKDCKYLKSQRFTTKKGTISRRNIYICEKKSEQISPKSEFCDNFKWDMNDYRYR